MATDLASLPWRTGRHFPRHMYAQLGEEPSDADPYVGTLETAELAGEACAAHNTMLDLGWLLAAGHDVQLGIYDYHGGPGYSVTLLDGETPHLAGFEGCATLGEGLAKAREWSEREGVTP